MRIMAVVVAGLGLAGCGIGLEGPLLGNVMQQGVEGLLVRENRPSPTGGWR